MILHFIALLVFTMAGNVAAVVFFNDSSNSSTRSTEWKLKGSLLQNRGTKVKIYELGFFEDSSCMDKVLISSTTLYVFPTGWYKAAENIFDNDSASFWEWYPTKEYNYFRVGFKDGENVSIKCIKINFTIDDKMDLLNLVLTSSHWNWVYEVRGLAPGMHTVDLTKNICKYEYPSHWNDKHCDPDLNNEGCEFDGQDCGGGNTLPAPSPPKIDEANHIQESTVIMIAIVVIVVFVFVFVTGLLLLRRKDGQRRRRKDQENEITPPTLLSTLTEVEQIKRRRDYVLNCIIHKKVSCSRLLIHEEQPVGKNGDIVLPHERELSLRQDETAADSSLGDCINPDENSQSYIGSLNDSSTEVSSMYPRLTNKKDYISVASVKSIREILRIDVCHEHSYYSSRTCPICCSDYKIGDEIAWSRNQRCHHAYHLECILEWLMMNGDCPMCRANYLEVWGMRRGSTSYRGIK